MKSFFYIGIAVALCAVSLVGYGMWYGMVSAKSASVATLQNSIAAKIETVNRIAATRASLADIAADEATVQSYFVPESGVVAFINSLETRGAAQKAAIQVLSVTEGGTKTQPALVFLITVKGTFNAVMRTVGSIEYAPYALTVSSFSIAQDDKNVWHADMKILVGSMPTTTATTSSSSNVPTTSTP
ncbi:MAG: hypothetical protein WA058_00395 [Minisyncoccia bacterium]